MSKPIGRRTIILVAIVILLINFSTSVLARAQEEPAGAISNVPVEGGPGFIMVSAYEFHPYNNTDKRAFSLSFLYNPNALTTTFEAPLSLPHGATITKVVLYFWDAREVDMSAYLTRCDLALGSCYAMAEVWSSGSDLSYRNESDISISSAKVDNQNNSYHLTVSIPGGITNAIMLEAVRIDYEFEPTFLPVIMK